MQQKKMKVYRAPSTDDVPQIKIQGQWLKDNGFQIGSIIDVRCDEEQLVVRLYKEPIVPK